MKALVALLCAVLAVTTLAVDSRHHGYVLRPGEGEGLGPTRLIKASPTTGTKGGVVVLDMLPAAFTTGPDFHRHDNADEFFYIISGSGSLEYSGTIHDVRKGDFVFVPAKTNHVLSVSASAPMEVLEFFDQPGMAEWFRRAHDQYFSKGKELTLEACNELGLKHAMTCVQR